MNLKMKQSMLVIISATVLSSSAMAVTNQSLQNSVARLEKEVASLKQQVQKKGQTAKNLPQHSEPPVTTNEASHESDDALHLLPYDLDLPGHAIVATGPYVGINISFSGSNLIVNSPSVNTDLQLLNLRKKVMLRLAELTGNVPTPEHSHLLFSGIIESQASYFKRGGEKHSTSDIDLTNVTLDATLFGPTRWLIGFMEFTYDNSQLVFIPPNNSRLANSRVYINKAFVTIGDLNCYPLYLTFGQFYVPFGRYSTFMVSDTLTKLLGRTKARSVLIGYSQQSANSLYASGYIFRGESHTGSVPKINNGGVNVGYKFDTGWMSGDIGGGVLGNLADSGGMQYGADFIRDERVNHRVTAFNARALVSLGTHIDLIWEYIASKKFSPIDMSYNGQGAQPSAYDVEASYSFTIFNGNPSSIGIGYSKSTEALALAIPASRTYVVFNTSLFRDTLQSLEFRRDREYSASSFATGATGAPSLPQTGKLDHSVTLQFDLYF